MYKFIYNFFNYFEGEYKNYLYGQTYEISQEEIKDIPEFVYEKIQIEEEAPVIKSFGRKSK